MILLLRRVSAKAFSTFKHFNIYSGTRRINIRRVPGKFLYADESKWETRRERVGDSSGKENPWQNNLRVFLGEHLQRQKKIILPLTLSLTITSGFNRETIYSTKNFCYASRVQKKIRKKTDYPDSPFDSCWSSCLLPVIVQITKSRQWRCEPGNDLW